MLPAVFPPTRLVAFAKTPDPRPSSSSPSPSSLPLPSPVGALEVVETAVSARCMRGAVFAGEEEGVFTEDAGGIGGTKDRDGVAVPLAEAATFAGEMGFSGVLLDLLDDVAGLAATGFAGVAAAGGGMGVAGFEGGTWALMRLAGRVRRFGLAAAMPTMGGARIAGEGNE